jgi:hypothetical protein
MELGAVAIRTRPIRIAEITRVTVGATRVVGCCALVASDLQHRLFSNREIENVVLMGRPWEVAVRPPLSERHVC